MIEKFKELLKDYKIDPSLTTLLVEFIGFTGNGQPHPVNMSYFIGSKFRLESSDNRFYIVTRV